MTIGRRQFLQFAGLGGALSATPFTRARDANSLPLSDLEAHVRMRGNPRGERNYWYYKGTVFGNAWGEATQPMLGVQGISFNTFEKLSDGSYRNTLTEAGYYSNVETGEVGGPVTNPFTGEDYEPEHYLSPQTIIFAPDLSVRPDIPSLPPGLEYRGSIAPTRVFGDRVITSEDLFVRMPHPQFEDDPERLPFTVQTSLATFTASRRDLLDESADFIPCQFNYQTLATFRAWMGMGRRQGMMSWRLVGNKCTRGELPGELAERIASDHVGFFS